MKINEVAKISGVTVRTLQYYDKIDLLKPNSISDNGYRIYNEESLEILQQILFFRELDFPLKEIKEIINNPDFDKSEALINQKNLLTKKRNRLNNIINLLDSKIKGEDNMSFKEFDISEIEETKKKYAKEAKEKYGSTSAYKEYEEKSKNYNNEKWQEVNGMCNDILKEFADNRESDPSCDKAQELVKKWQDYITNNFYKCTKEILAGLGLMYVNDERFKENIDKNGEGTAEFLSKAIEIYCEK